MDVEIRVSPGEPAHPVLLGRRTGVTVTILGTATLETSAIDPGSIHIDGVQVNKERMTIADVNGDGIADLTFKVPVGTLRLQEGSSFPNLRAVTTDGQSLKGKLAVTSINAPLADPVQEKLPELLAQIDILPGDAANLVDLGAPGDLEVAILGSESFIAQDIDLDTVNLAGARVAENVDGDLTVATADLNADGRLDLILSFPRRDMRVSTGSATADLRGALKNGRPFVGSDLLEVQGVGTTPPGVTPSFATTFDNPTPILIPAAGTSGVASPYPSNIMVAGLGGSVTKVTVSLKDFIHTFPDDIDVLLVGPGGQNLVVMGDVGGGTDVSLVAVTLDDSAASPLPDAGPLVSGTFRPNNVTAGDAFPAPAPAPSAATALATFNGTNPNGTWSLYVVDDAGGDSGRLAGGWSLTISTSQVEVCSTDPVVIPGTGTAGPANPYPSTINFSGLPGLISAVTVTFNGIEHTFPDDIDVLLEGPTGANATVMSDAMGFSTVSGLNITLDDAAASPIPDNSAPVSGSYQPANHTGADGTDVFPAPAPAPSGASALATFNGTVPLGDWHIWVSDDASGDIGSFAGGWCLNVTTTTCGSGPACDDNNPCTDDACSQVTGLCTFTNDDTNACTDGDPCTADACVAGACVSTPGQGTYSFSNPAAVLLPAAGTSGIAAPYPSTILVPDLGGTVTDVSLTIHGVRHTFPDDLDMLLQGPAGQNLVFMSDAGLSGDLTNAELTFSDGASQSLPDSAQIVSGSYRPTNFIAGDAFPAPSPAPSAATMLSVFDGTNPQGGWNLFIVDDAGGDSGALAGGWTLNVTVDCDDGDACTIDTCTPTGCTHAPVDCNDNNSCTDDSCDPGTGCVNTPNDANACSDGNACTTADSCQGGSCVGGPPPDCNDGNPCTTDSCDPGTGCVNTNNTDPCSDGNACTTNDTCGGGTCNGGPPPNCDDGNVCTDDSCDPGTGCVNTNNTDPCNDGNACTTGDTCGGGTCNGGAPPNCNDGNVCTDDSCDPGTGCVNTSNNTCNTKGQGYWKRLCHGPHSGDFYTAFDVDCVNNTCTFASVQTTADLCDRLNASPPNDACERAEVSFMSLVLNLCRQRVLPSQSINSRCGPHQTAGESRTIADGALCNPERTDDDCHHAECASDEVANGEALWANSLRLSSENGGVRLTWSAPYSDPNTLVPRKYRVFRKSGLTDPFVQVGEINNGSTTWFDAGAASGTIAYEYEVVSIW